VQPDDDGDAGDVPSELRREALLRVGGLGIGSEDDDRHAPIRIEQPATQLVDVAVGDVQEVGRQGQRPVRALHRGEQVTDQAWAARPDENADLAPVVFEIQPDPWPVRPDRVRIDLEQPEFGGVVDVVWKQCRLLGPVRGRHPQRSRPAAAVAQVLVQLKAAASNCRPVVRSV
jgi:hypothetical protein